MKIQQLLGERIKAAIRSSPLTQVEIAGKLGISENGLTNYVKGRRVPDVILLVRMSHLLDLPPSAFLDTLLQQEAGDTQVAETAVYSSARIKTEHVEQAYILIKAGLGKHKLPVTSEAYILGLVAEWLSEGKTQEQVLEEFSEMVEKVLKQRRLHRH